jgi:hypothetical protein
MIMIDEKILHTPQVDIRALIHSLTTGPYSYLGWERYCR